LIASYRKTPRFQNASIEKLPCARIAYEFLDGVAHWTGAEARMKPMLHQKGDYTFLDADDKTTTTETV